MDYLLDHGAWKIVTEDNSYGEMEAIEIGVGWKGQGVILFRATEEELDYFKENNIAVCLLSSEGPDGGFPRVIPDNESIGDLAARHLLETGAQHFGFLARGETFYNDEKYASGERIYPRDRLKGYVRQLEKRGFEPDVFYLKGFPLWKKNTWKKIEKDVSAYLKSLPQKTALFCADDALASVALRVAEKQNIKVPENLMVLGFGNTINYCYSSLPSMSSIVYPGRTIGREVAKMLDAQLSSTHVDQQDLKINIDEVKERESTSHIAIDDPEIAKLVKWVRLKATTDAIQVSDLEEQSNYSLSSIKLKFSQTLGHSPKDEIKQVRVARLKHHLKNISKNLSDISAEMDFRSTEEMSRFFLRETGMRPSVYRKELLKK